jgi:predicted aspartyl protease
MHYSAEVVVEIEDRHGNLVPIRALIDTGTSSSIVLREFVAKDAPSHTKAIDQVVYIGRCLSDK